MSLILEALSKAEQSNGISNYGHAPQTYPLEKKATTKKTLLLLVAIACLSSAIVTLLIIYIMGSNNKALSTSRDNAQEPISAVAKETPADRAIYRKASAIQAPPETMPSNENLNAQTAPGFGHLINRKSRINAATHQPANATQATTAPAPAALEVTLGTQQTPGDPKPQYFGKARNTQLTDIEISVHMYSKTPKKRFVYINSTRYSENALISDGIVLYEITENGIILDVNGTLYRMPIKL